MADAFDHEPTGDDLGNILSSFMESLTRPEPRPTIEKIEGFDGRNLDMLRFGRCLAASDQPLTLLCNLGSEVYGAPCASEFAIHLCDRLSEAGLLEKDTEFPEVKAVRTKTSGLFYLRSQDSEMTYLAKTRLIAIEAALNLSLLAQGRIEDVNNASEEDLVRFEGALVKSVAAQAGHAVPVDGSGEAYPRTGGEWDTRYAICEGFESFRLPWRLSYNLRVNVAGRCCAIEADSIGSRLMLETCYLPDLGVIQTTGDMRRVAAADYDTRVMVLAASHALMRCPDLDRVFVATVDDSPAGYACLCSAEIARADIAELNLADFDPIEFMRGISAAIKIENGGLAPVKQGFSLNSEQFCPARRWDPPETSAKRLSSKAAAGLGVQTVAELGCDQRREMNELVKGSLSRFSSSTENNVRELLSMRGQASDPYTVQNINRVISELLEGELEDDPEAISDDLLTNTDLVRALEKAQGLCTKGAVDEAIGDLRDAVQAIDETGLYEDGPFRYCRHFDRYIDRLLWNRMVAPVGWAGEVRLVPEAYVEANILLSGLLFAAGKKEDSLRYARRAARVAPLSMPASMQLAQCLQAAGDHAASKGELYRMLSLAHDPETLGVTYSKLIVDEWRDGNARASQACYHMAAKWMPRQILDLGTRVASHLGANCSSLSQDMSEAEIREALGAQGIPYAPNEDVIEVMGEIARAALDEEIFYAAKGSLYFLCLLSKDDVLHSVYRSLEDEPDR